MPGLSLDADDLLAVAIQQPASSETFYCAVDWGDGFMMRYGRNMHPMEANSNGLYSHTYKQAGTYNVRIVVAVDSAVEIMTYEALVGAADGVIGIRRVVHEPADYPDAVHTPYVLPTDYPSLQEIFG